MQVLTGLRFVSFAVKRQTFPPMFSPNKWGIKLTDTTHQQNQTRHFLRLFFAQDFLFRQTREANWKCSKSIVFERLFIIVQRKVNSFCKEKELLLSVFTLSDRRRLFLRRNSHVKAHATRAALRFFHPAYAAFGAVARKHHKRDLAAKRLPRPKGLCHTGGELLPLKPRSVAFGWNWK